MEILVFAVSLAAIAVVGVAIILAILIYNQMLLINEVNKRLLLMAQEAYENGRISMEEYNQRLQDLEDTKGSHPEVKPRYPLEESDDDNEEPFSPHSYNMGEEQ